PDKSVQFVNTTDRDAVKYLLRESEFVDLIIPRGGEGLIKFVAENSLIPVIKHYKGVCHTFVSRNADFRIASDIVVNAKTQRTGVCNAMETLLIDSGMKVGLQRELITALLDNGVTLYGDRAAKKLDKRVKLAKSADWGSEYLDMKLSVKCVDGVDSAIDHINKYGSNHTDAIISKDKKEAERFIERVDSSSVMINTSTRFSDGGEYGMGCEIGISTDKLHARGPMGIDDLTTYKWIVKGKGQIRS
ncbi:MAG: glutamate-5-semialdehyde dehydrogenase, partial [Chitinivibrionales bacterium]